MLLTLATALPAVAQSVGDNIRFALMPLESDEIPAEVATAIDGKLRQALNRTSALSDGESNALAVIPTLAVGEAVESEGLMQEVGRIKAELTLTAVNHIDGTVFFSSTIPLTGSAVGGKKSAMKAMATGIKPSDPVYVRFIRKSREKVSDHYATNCATILQRAQQLADSGHPDEAAACLGSVPAEVDCYETARMLLAELSGTPADTPPAAVSPDTVYVEREVPVPVHVPVPVPTPAPTPEPEPMPEPEPAATPAPAAEPEQQTTIKLSDPDEFDFKIISCLGLSNGDQVKILGEMKNLKINAKEVYMQLDQAFDSNGEECPRNNLSTRGRYASYINIPQQVPVKIEFTVNNVSPSVSSFSFMKIVFGNYSVSIYNLPVQWN